MEKGRLQAEKAVSEIALFKSVKRPRRAREASLTAVQGQFMIKWMGQKRYAISCRPLILPILFPFIFISCDDDPTLTGDGEVGNEIHEELIDTPTEPCGNGICEPDENCEICPYDCPCTEDAPICLNGECVECLTRDDCPFNHDCTNGTCTCDPVPNIAWVCSDEPGARGSGVSFSCPASPVEDTMHVSEVSPAGVVVWVDVSPLTLPADGHSTGTTIVTLTHMSSGRRITDARVRFMATHFIESPEGEVLGPCDEPELEVSYLVLDGIFWIGGEYPTTALDGTTGPDGTASAVFQVPAWEDYMAGKPLTAGAWFDFSGGGNPFGSQMVYLEPP